MSILFRTIFQLDDLLYNHDFLTSWIIINDRFDQDTIEFIFINIFESIFLIQLSVLDSALLSITYDYDDYLEVSFHCILLRNVILKYYAK